MSKRRSRKPRQRLPVRALLRQPAGDFYRLPELEIRGGTILTEGCRKVLDFTPEKLCLDLGAFVVTFYGRGLRIESLNGKRAVVAGAVGRIDLTAKWGDTGHAGTL